MQARINTPTDQLAEKYALSDDKWWKYKKTPTDWKPLQDRRAIWNGRRFIGGKG